MGPSYTRAVCYTPTWSVTHRLGRVDPVTSAALPPARSAQGGGRRSKRVPGVLGRYVCVNNNTDINTPDTSPNTQQTNKIQTQQINPNSPTNPIVCR
eukprot:COSAG01_NODE_129_length_24935_cov_39.324368_23_plen_97_part_00